jgi:hypothetical protein
MADASCAVLFQDKDHGKTMDRPTMIFFCAPSEEHSGAERTALEFRKLHCGSVSLPIRGVDSYDEVAVLEM